MESTKQSIIVADDYFYEGNPVFEFLKRHKIRDRAALRQSLVDRGHADIPHHDSDAFDAILPAVLTQELIASDFSSHFEPMDSSPAIDVSSSFDSGGGFDPGGGFSGGGGADGNW